MLDQLDKDLATIERVPDRSPTYLIEAVASSGMLGKDCSALLDDSLNANPANRGVVMSRAHAVCKMPCPSPKVFAELVDHRPTEWHAAVEADCNHGGPDPIFGTDADARRRTDVGVYLQTRFVVQASIARLSSDGSERAKQLAVRIGALVPHLARALQPASRTEPAQSDGTSVPGTVNDELARADANRHDAGVLGPQGGADLAEMDPVRERQGGSGADGTADGSAASTPKGRITVASKRALGESSLTADVLVAKIQSVYIAGLERCYKQRLAAEPGAHGSMQIRLSVEPTGRAIKIQVASFHPDHESCAKGLVQDWRFPRPIGPDGEPVLAAFEITLQHAPD